jgi:hypothetical protein
MSRPLLGDESAKESNAMTKSTTATRIPPSPNLQSARQDVDRAFERFCLTADIGTIEQMLCDDARQLTGAPYRRGEHRVVTCGGPEMSAKDGDGRSASMPAAPADV